MSIKKTKNLHSAAVSVALERSKISPKYETTFTITPTKTTNSHSPTIGNTNQQLMDQHSKGVILMQIKRDNVFNPRLIDFSALSLPNKMNK